MKDEPKAQRGFVLCPGPNTHQHGTDGPQSHSVTQRKDKKCFSLQMRIGSSPPVWESVGSLGSFSEITALTTVIVVNLLRVYFRVEPEGLPKDHWMILMVI